jgi:hypothetical protein
MIAGHSSFRPLLVHLIAAIGAEIARLLAAAMADIPTERQLGFGSNAL